MGRRGGCQWWCLKIRVGGPDGGDLDLRVGFFLSPNALPWDGDGMNQVISLFQAPVGHLQIARHGGRLMEEMKQTAFVQRMQKVN